MSFQGFRVGGGVKKPAKKALAAALFDEDGSGDEAMLATPGLQPAELQEQGNRAAEGGDWSLALRRWDEALAAGPANPHFLHEQKAQAFLEIGDPWRAIQSATTATQLQPGWAEGHLTLARAQLNFGEAELALESMNRVLQLQPDNADAREEINTVRMLVLQRRQQQQQQQQQRAAAAGGAADSGPCCRRLRVVEHAEQGD